ncbi:hypothetical protein [Thalassomonas actiniarum]|uniref:Uncharacterized protein n=1 Tax=Thalassomonas actiniarum TaxID=485447 RepID=A0AAE9YXK3_9GAMM|nr:hypothetical protein [Thalassomonas actiniarum]WDE02239.1 hypothetical protein SG35_031275 [Thalassomonas actiniarum]
MFATSAQAELTPQGLYECTNGALYELWLDVEGGTVNEIRWVYVGRCSDDGLYGPGIG